MFVTGTQQGMTRIYFATAKYDPTGRRRWLSLYDAGNCSPGGGRSIALDGAGNAHVTGQDACFATRTLKSR